VNTRVNFMIAALTILLALTLFGCTEQKTSEVIEKKVKEIDLSAYKPTRPERTMRLLFIHHSVGGQWLADRGERQDIIPDSSLHIKHPNGGGLRSLLIENNYQVHEASYKSDIGEKTDINDWNAKFRDKMDAMLKCDMQDTPYNVASIRNNIVMFKSCFPNNDIISEGKEPGDPDSAERTTANVKSAYRKILNYFGTHPNTLFVCVTAPPLAKNIPSRTKEVLKNLIGSEDSVKAIGERARRLNNWLKDTEKGWLSGYGGKNVVVFDYYDVLTRHGESDYLMYPTENGFDSHPSAEGNTIAAREFAPFLNRAVNRFTAAH
jgi:hypothetical protein